MRIKGRLHFNEHSADDYQQVHARTRQVLFRGFLCRHFPVLTLSNSRLAAVSSLGRLLLRMDRLHCEANSGSQPSNVARVTCSQGREGGIVNVVS